jgi:hypothetical protein
LLSADAFAANSSIVLIVAICVTNATALRQPAAKRARRNVKGGGCQLEISMRSSASLNPFSLDASFALCHYTTNYAATDFYLAEQSQYPGEFVPTILWVAGVETG